MRAELPGGDPTASHKGVSIGLFLVPRLGEHRPCLGGPKAGYGHKYAGAVGVAGRRIQGPLYNSAQSPNSQHVGRK